MEHLLLATTVLVGGGAAALAVVCTKLRADNVTLSAQVQYLQEQVTRNEDRHRTAAIAAHDELDEVHAELDATRRVMAWYKASHAASHRASVWLAQHCLVQDAKGRWRHPMIQMQNPHIGWRITTKGRSLDL